MPVVRVLAETGGDAMKILDLFAGLGGFSLAAHWLGWQTAAFVEKEPFCQKLLAKNFNGVPIYGDIFEFDGTGFREAVDVVCGGFPCQPFSAAGKREGRNDERHLFPEMLRVIREVRPRWVVAENVRGLLSIENGRLFAEIVALLESEDFEVVTFCIPASALGAPHRRDRLWIVANAKGERRKESARLDGIRDAESAEDGRTGIADGFGNADCNGDASALGAPHRRDRLWIVANANGIRKRTGHREIQIADGKISKRDNNAKFGNADCNGDASDTDERSSGSRADGKPDGAQFVECGADDSGGRDAPDTGCQHGSAGRDGGMEAGSSERPARVFDAQRCGENGIWSANWLDVALKYCIRQLDDGFPAGLGNSERNTIIRAIKYFGREEVEGRLGCDLRYVEQNIYRNDGLRALGNAIVPQIAYEIFKAIQEAESDE